MNVGKENLLKVKISTNQFSDEEMENIEKPKDTGFNNEEMQYFVFQKILRIMLIT